MKFSTDLNLGDALKGYHSAVKTAYDALLETAAKAVMTQANNAVGDGKRGDDLHNSISSLLGKAADTLAYSVDADRYEECNELEELVDITEPHRQALLDRLDPNRGGIADCCLPQQGGLWVVTGERRERCLAYVPDEEGE